MEDLLLHQIVLDLVDHERDIPWLYCDDRGYVTIGVGNLVKTESDTERFPLINANGVPATSKEKAAAWRLVSGAYREQEPKFLADYYKRLTNLRLSKEDSKAILLKRLRTEFIPGLLKVFPEMESWPSFAIRATVDMVFSLGVGGLVSGYPTHTKSLKTTRFDISANECYRRKKGQDPHDPSTWIGRNLWTREMYLAASRAARVA